MELLTVQETAELLKVAPVTVRRYIASGRLAAVRVGRGLRVERQAAEGLAVPVKTRRVRRRLNRSSRIPRGRPTTADDPLWNIVGIITGDGPGDVSSNKRKYLADAYSPRSQPIKHKESPSA